MSPTGGPSGDEPAADATSDDVTAAYLRAALESATDDDVRYHVRQALQHHLFAREEAGGE